ncbi:DUF4163 domain-containing protein [Lysinibacillus endophyticus]|uniref:PdaC/SigV domain-containing protein n=1 Tax=Ureibacillus endophyticus TaxID=1978490 RepID=UPI003136573D
MIKKTVVPYCIIFLLILTACSNKESTDTLEVTKMEENEHSIVKEDSKGYELKSETFTEGNVTIQYPQIINLTNEEKQKEINEFIKKEALAPFLETIQSLEPDQEYEAEGYYEIKLKNNDTLSIAYYSYNYISTAAHPYNLFFTTNIDLKTAKPLYLSDFVSTIDKDFIALLKKAKYVGSLEEGYDQQINELAFSQYSSDEELLSALTTNDGHDYGIYVYVTEKALGIVMPVPHAAGDYAEFEIPISDLKS